MSLDADGATDPNQLYTDFTRSLRDEFQRLSDVSSLPVLPASGPRITGTTLNSDVTWMDVSDPANSEQRWSELAAMFTANRTDNVRPWYRCIGVLRGLGARTVVIERYYVCLDHKSEHASFYAHIDERREATTVRMHFFANSVAEGDLARLGQDDVDSYLGYIVCRRGNLPLVGRAMIKVPDDYIDECTAVEEPVNFLGQSLKVRGVPFMQQDARFAVCADVAIWTLAYTAYRRGLSERRVIADIVERSGTARPLRPRVPAGLTADATAKVLGALGFSTILLDTPHLTAFSSTLPALYAPEVPDQLKAQIATVLAEPSWPDKDLNVTADLESRLRSFTQTLGEKLRKELDVPTTADATMAGTAGETKSETVAEPPFPRDAPQVKAFEMLLDHLVAVYIRSRMPVYLSTSNHALVLCGRSKNGEAVRYFVHDDQNGPYLAIDGLSTISGSALREQSGWVASGSTDEGAIVPPVDPLRSWTSDQPLADDGFSVDLAVDSIVVATPARAMVQPWLCVAQAVAWERGIRSFPTLPAGDPLVRVAPTMRQVLLMGIDYKSLRREQSLSVDDEPGAATFSALHLPEWVLVVEGVSDDNRVIWENVYDASSGETPRMMFSRVGRLALVAPLYSHGSVQPVRVHSETYPPAIPPSRVGKVAPTSVK